MEDTEAWAEDSVSDLEAEAMSDGKASAYSSCQGSILSFR